MLLAGPTRSHLSSLPQKGRDVTSRRRRSEWRGLRMLGIGVLILSTVRFPLPQADYHNVRHHDAPGEVCPYHDHLLRWHPSAGLAADVAILHWHWFMPLADPGPLDDSRHQGPLAHAHINDWLAPDWTGTPMVRPETRGRIADLLVLGLNGPIAWPSSAWADLDDPGPRFSSHMRTIGDAGLRIAILDLVARWNC